MASSESVSQNADQIACKLFADLQLPITLPNATMEDVMEIYAFVNSFAPILKIANMSFGAVVTGLCFPGHRLGADLLLKLFSSFLQLHALCAKESKLAYTKKANGIMANVRQIFGSNIFDLRIDKNTVTEILRLTLTAAGYRCDTDCYCKELSQFANENGTLIKKLETESIYGIGTKDRLALLKALLNTLLEYERLRCVIAERRARGEDSNDVFSSIGDGIRMGFVPIGLTAMSTSMSKAEEENAFRQLLLEFENEICENHVGHVSSSNGRLEWRERLEASGDTSMLCCGLRDRSLPCQFYPLSNSQVLIPCEELQDLTTIQKLGVAIIQLAHGINIECLQHPFIVTSKTDEKEFYSSKCYQKWQASIVECGSFSSLAVALNTLHEAIQWDFKSNEVMTKQFLDFETLMSSYDEVNKEEEARG